MRSGIAAENLHEVLSAATSVRQALTAGQAQYETPGNLAQVCSEFLPSQPCSVFDPQCASGNLLHPHESDYKFGWDIDNRFEEQDDETTMNRLIGNCVDLAALLDDVFPETEFPCIVANPPFGIRWKMLDGTGMDSTAWTWRFITEHLAYGGCGYFIASWKTIEALGIRTHPWVYLYQKFPVGLWENVSVEIGIVHFCNSQFPIMPRMEKEWLHLPSDDEMRREIGLKLGFNNKPRPPYSVFHREWETMGKILEEEESKRSKFNIYLTKAGMLRTYLSTRAKIKMSQPDVIKLSRIQDCHPLTLTTEKESRKLLNELLSAGVYTIEPEARVAIDAALAEVNSIACPIRPVTDFEFVAYADEEDSLVARATSEKFPLTVGKRYNVNTGTYRFTQKFTRKKLHFDEASGETKLREHDCELTGADRYIQITDDDDRFHRFMDRPALEVEGVAIASRKTNGVNEWPEEMLWEFFDKPLVHTIKEVKTELYNRNLSTMRMCEMIAGYKYFDGQLDYYARMGCKDYGLIAADVGTGKTLGALTMVALKTPKRTLIIAPQGTMRSSDDDEEQEYEASQWVKEINRFAPTEPVFQLFSLEDWLNIKRANGGEIPPGVYITYHQAYFQNGAFEVIPEAWDDEKEHEAKFCKRMGLPYEDEPAYNERICLGVGEINAAGIRCIAEPCLSTIVSTEMGEWDMIIIDEAHLCCNLHAQVTKNLLRLQPKYRFAMTATPIPNILSNIFSLMGWLCVPNWYIGGKRNAAWPYASNEIGRFNGTFLSFEEDMTAKEIARAAGKKAARTIRVSPIISSPARLLKLLKPTMAYISKEDCNPKLQPCKVIDVRVPMGTTQSELYTYWLDRGNYYPEYKSPLTIARVQQSRLRGITASPASVDYNYDAMGKKTCRSNFNPKTAAILQLIMQCIEKGEQCVVVSARVEQSGELARRLRDAGIPVARIDSTITSVHHTAEANRFKRGDARVMLMGIKCAQGHSFDGCPNLIVGSLEWSYGTLHQARGRVWRLTSPKPVTVWCVLHKGSIEELLFDRVALKQDAATLCLMGRRIPRDFKTMDAAEILAEHIFEFDDTKVKTVHETESERGWPDVRRRLSMARNMHLIDRQ